MLADRNPVRRQIERSKPEVAERTWRLKRHRMLATLSQHRMAMACTDIVSSRAISYQAGANKLWLDRPVLYGELYAHIGRETVRGAGRHEPDGELLATSVSMFTSNSKMVCNTWSLPAGPTAFGGTCVPSDMLYVHKRVATLRREAEINEPAARDRWRRFVERYGRRLPDQTEWICNYCYAIGGHYTMEQAQLGQAVRLEWTRRAMRAGTFIETVVETLRELRDRQTFTRSGAVRRVDALTTERRHPDYVRLHDSGDFFSTAYLRAWAEIARQLPEIRFWAGTRAWADPGLGDAMGKIELPKNLVIRPSELFVGEAFSPKDWPGLGANTGVKLPRWPRMNENTWLCPATHTDVSSCQNQPANYPGAAKADGRSPWSGGCRFCWNAPRYHVEYGEH
jgi:hypothetical protein